jgi:hypothetical protein
MLSGFIRRVLGPVDKTSRNDYNDGIIHARNSLSPKDTFLSWNFLPKIEFHRAICVLKCY